MVFHKTDKSTRPVSPSRRRAKSPAPRKSPRVVPKSPVRQAPLRASTPKSGSLKSRTPLRSKSPMRTRSSLGKSGEEIFDKETLASRPSPRLQIEIESDSDIPDGGGKEAEKPKAAVRGRARRLEIQADKEHFMNSLNFRNHYGERIIPSQDLPNIWSQSSEDDDSGKQSKSLSKKTREFKQKTEFGGPLGAAFFILFLPLVSILFFIACNEQQCSFFKSISLQRFRSINSFFDLNSILGFTIFLIILAVISVLPFGGKRVTGLPTQQGTLNYKMNGFFAGLYFTVLLIALEFMNIPITNYISENLFQILIAAIIHGFLLSVYLYIKSFYVPSNYLNPNLAPRQSIFYELFMGRELHPKMFGLLDLKFLIYRSAPIILILLDLSLIYGNKSSFNTTLIALFVIRSIYFWDSLICESSLLSSFEVQYEGCGYMTVMGYLVSPFWLVTSTKYVIDFNVELPNWHLVLSTTVFLIGYTIYRSSNNQKNAFRQNPYNPALSYLKTISTRTGTKLICSSFWGFVRHPNYLGDILIQISFVLMVFKAPPMIVSSGLILVLIHRSVRDHYRCKEKYGSAWNRYCHKVKYVLIPYVY